MDAFPFILEKNEVNVCMPTTMEQIDSWSMKRYLCGFSLKELIREKTVSYS